MGTSITAMISPKSPILKAHQVSLYSVVQNKDDQISTFIRPYLKKPFLPNAIITKKTFVPLKKASMNSLSAGNYLGNKVDYYVHKKIIISKNEYCSVENKDWHCHDNSFFAYFLRGGNFEIGKIP